jgi:hypothetical protein
MLAYVFLNALPAALTLRYPLIMDHFVKKLLATEKHGAITRYLGPVPYLVHKMMRAEQGTMKI